MAPAMGSRAFSRRHARRTVSVTLGEMRPDALPLCEGPLWSPDIWAPGGLIHTNFEC